MNQAKCHSETTINKTTTEQDLINVLGYAVPQIGLVVHWSCIT